MASFNKVILIGNLTRDVEIRQAGRTSVCDVGLAVNERIKRDGNWVEDVQFIDVTLFWQMCDIVAQYCRKGSPLFVEGHLKLDSWDKDGKTMRKLKVIGDRIQLLGGKQERAEASTEPLPANAGAAARKEAAERREQGGVDDVPF